VERFLLSCIFIEIQDNTVAAYGQCIACTIYNIFVFPCNDLNKREYMHMEHFKFQLYMQVLNLVLTVFFKEALQREQLLENKLATLQRLVETTRQASDLGWKALIDEDRLLSRVEILENQLQMYSKVRGICVCIRGQHILKNLFIFISVFACNLL
jgi:hypothetical protein